MAITQHSKVYKMLLPTHKV